MTLPKKTSIDPHEVAKFTAMADEWWDASGKFKPLHLFNPVRLTYLRDTICAHLGKENTTMQPLKGVELIDIGCGGGLLSEPVARMGANVTAIDASEKNIAVASLHAKNEGVKVDYRASSAEQEAAQKKQYDVVMAMEIIEHVADVPAFLESCAKLVKPGGLLFVATLNRTAKSYLFAILGAEYVLRWLPRGTHDWSKFLKPSEIVTTAEPLGLAQHNATGVSFNPLSSQFSLTEDLSVNYMLSFTKKK